MKRFEVKETNLEEALKVFSKIKEFDRTECGTVQYCLNRFGHLQYLVLAAYVDNVNAGYFIAYEKDNSFYCWVAGVDPTYRRMGILTEMMKIYEEYAKKHSYNKLTLKTMNNKREMLSYLVKNNWNFTEVIAKNDVLDNEILVEKNI